jgi:hypothetical protein
MWYPLIKAAMESREDYDLGKLYNVLPSDLMFRDDEIFLPLQAADMLAWITRMAFSGVRNEFEWIATELSPLIPISGYSSLFDAQRMEGIHLASLKMKFPPSLIQEWKEKLGLR